MKIDYQFYKDYWKKFFTSKGFEFKGENMEMIDEEKMKEFDELHQQALDTMKAAEDARNKFFAFVEKLKETKFMPARGLNYKKCQISSVSLPRFKIFQGFIGHKCLNRSHWWSPHRNVNNFGKFCDALRNRDIVLLEDDTDNKIDFKI